MPSRPVSLEPRGNPKELPKIFGMMESQGGCLFNKNYHSIMIGESKNVDITLIGVLTAKLEIFSQLPQNG